MNTDWKRKDSFVMYTDHKDELELLNMKQRGLLLTAIMTYQDSGEVIELDDSTAMLFSVIRKELDRNAKKYYATIEQRRRAGAAGGRASARKRRLSLEDFEANEAFAAFAAADEANQADNENDNVNENENENDCCCSRTTTITRPFRPPTEEEVVEMLREFEYDPDFIPSTAKSFMRYNAADNWLNCQRHYPTWEYALTRFLENERTTNETD